MSQVDCIREQEALDAILDGRWPDACDAELRAHAASCEVCASLVHVAVALRAEHEAAMREAQHVPTSGAMWWRVQLRTRNEKATVARETFAAVHALAILGALVAAVLIIGATQADWWQRVSPSTADVLALARTLYGLPLILGIGAWLAMMPVVAWLAVSRD